MGSLLSKRNPKAVEEMSAAAINKALDRLSDESSKITDAFIEAGRGYERPSEYLKMSDPLALRARVNWEKRSALIREIELRAGPGMNRLPKGFGPRRRNAGIIPGPNDVDASLKEWGGYLKHDRRNPEAGIIYEHGDYYIIRSATKGFDVYKNVGTHAVRVSQIGYEGDKGLQRSKQEIERRESEDAKKRNPSMTSIVPVVRQGKQVFEAAVRSAKGVVKDTFQTIQGAEAFVRLHAHEVLDAKKNPAGWYTIVGQGSLPKPARGPFDSLGKAERAMDSFRERYGYKADTYLNSSSALIAGPYATRAQAANADIGDSRLKVARRNPDSEAASLFEEFHGAPPESDMEVVYDEHEHETVTALGDLAQLKVITPMGKDVTLNVAPAGRGQELPDPSEMPIEKRVILTSNEDGTQLFFTGGDQSIDTEALGFTGDLEKEHMMLGVLYEVTYQTAKGFDKFKLTNYYHELGEETGNQPFLVYDSLSQLMKVVGGEYVIKAEGICN